MILDCDCKHDFQDATYGKGKRKHNPTKKGYRCVVCGKTKDVKRDENPPKQKSK
jgi:hypothetical protein